MKWYENVSAKRRQMSETAVANMLKSDDKWQLHDGN